MKRRIKGIRVIKLYILVYHQRVKLHAIITKSLAAQLFAYCLFVMHISYVRFALSHFYPYFLLLIPYIPYNSSSTSHSPRK